MLSKLFLTLSIIFLVALILKRRPSQESGAQGARTSAKVGGERPKLSELRLAAYLFLVIMLGLGGVISVQKWRDDHTVVTIKLYSAGESVQQSIKLSSLNSTPAALLQSMVCRSWSPMMSAWN